MSDPADRMLVLALPAALQEELLDHLGSHPQWVSGVTILSAEGVGSGTALRSSMERVRGRASRKVILLLLAAAAVEPLLQDLATTFRTTEIAWWLLPVMGFGRLA